MNSCNPGLIDTPIFEAVGMSRDETAKLIENYSKRYPAGRIGRVDDVAKCIEFLASDQAEFITGVFICVFFFHLNVCHNNCLSFVC